MIAATSFVAAAHTPSYAQSAEAEALFNDGDKLLKAGKTAEACDAFEASNKLEPRAGTMIRLGECREKNKQLASAWSAYKDSLTRVKDPKKRAIAEKKVAELEPKLSYLTISVADAKLAGLTITRNGQTFDSVLWNRALPVNGGDFTVIATAPGKAEWKTSVTVPVEKGKITVSVPALEAPRSRPDPVTPDGGRDTANSTTSTGTTDTTGATSTTVGTPGDGPSDSGPASSRWTGKRKLALAAGGIAVAGLAVGIVLGNKAKAQEDDAFALCPEDPSQPCAGAMEANRLLDDASTKARNANILFGVAGLAAIGAAVLWVTGAPDPARGVAIVPGPGTLDVVGRF